MRKQTRISLEFVIYSIFNDLIYIRVSLSNKYAINENSTAAILRKFHEHIFTWKMVPNVGHIHAYSTQQMLRISILANFHFHTRCLASQHVPFTNFTKKNSKLLNYFLSWEVLALQNHAHCGLSTLINMRQHLVRCVKSVKFSEFSEIFEGKWLVTTSNHNHKMLQIR